MESVYFAQKAFIVNNNKLLIIKKSKDDPYQPDKWEVPGGRIEEGETLLQHIQREVKEEAGININVGNPFYMWDWYINPDDKKRVVAVAVICTFKSGHATTENQLEDDYIDKIEWVKIDELYSYNFFDSMKGVISYFIEHYSQLIELNENSSTRE
jgi:mutator protein MutT